MSGSCKHSISIPVCPLHKAPLEHVFMTGCDEDCPIGVWCCPIDLRTGLPMDGAVSFDNPLPDDAECPFMVGVRQTRKGLIVEEISDDEDD